MQHIIKDLRHVINSRKKNGETFGDAYEDIECIVNFILNRFKDPVVILSAHRKKEKGKTLEEVLYTAAEKALIY